jgi:crossover junction endodeoxyribonuclease RusA
MEGCPVTRTWTLTVAAPFVKPVVKRKTGKVFQRQPFLNSNDRDHWRVTNPIKNGWITSAITAAEEAGIPKGLGRVQIDGHIIKPRGGTYDAMNYYPTAKALVDGLTRYGLTVDDSNEYVRGPFLHEGGKGDPAIVLTITELEEA